MGFTGFFAMLSLVRGNGKNPKTCAFIHFKSAYFIMFSMVLGKEHFQYHWKIQGFETQSDVPNQIFMGFIGLFSTF